MPSPELDLADLPLVTVMVPVYNQAQYVRECLDSVIANGYPNVELVIINDASPDHSDAQVQEWLNDHPGVRAVYVRHEENRGLTRTLNEGARLAKGEFFTPIAADDLLVSGSIAAQVAYLQSHPDKLAVFADCHVIDEHGKTLHESGIEGLRGCMGMRKRLMKIDALVPYGIVFNWAIPGPVFFGRTAAFGMVGFYDEKLAIEDWDMYLRIAAIGKLGFLDHYVACYRVHGTSSTQTVINHRWIHDTAATAKKALAQYRGLNRMRLLSFYLNLRHHDEPNPVRRAVLILAGRGLALVAKLFYVPMRAAIAVSHGVSPFRR